MNKEELESKICAFAGNFASKLTNPALLAAATLSKCQFPNGKLISDRHIIRGQLLTAMMLGCQGQMFPKCWHCQDWFDPPVPPPLSPPPM